MAIVLVIILVVIGMITQGSEKEKGCGWTIVACVAFLLFLSQLGISSENAANIFLWVIGIGTILLIIWGISQSKKNNNSNPTAHSDNMIPLEKNQKYNEIHQDITEQSIAKEKRLEGVKDVCEVIEKDKKDEETLNFKEVIKKEEKTNKKFEFGDSYQRLVNCIANYTQNEQFGDERNNSIEAIKLEEKANEKLYEQKIKSMVNEFQKCTSINDIIKTYIENRSESDIFNPANIGLLRGYLVRNTSYKEKKNLSSIELIKIVREKSKIKNNYSAELFNMENVPTPEIISEKDLKTANEENTNFYFTLVLDEDVEDDRGSVYSPVKIQPESKELLEPYKTFDEMRKLVNDNLYYFDKRDAKIFVKQAKFMKDFQDNYDTVVSFQNYSPTYMLMSDLQLRTYFTWRTKIRNGECIDCSPSYLYLYINEIINNVGVKNNQDAIEKLFSLYKVYKNIDHQFKKYMMDWIKDYYILNNFKHDFKAVIAPYKNVGLYEEYDDESLFGYYDKISNYKIRESKFYSLDKINDISNCFEIVIKNLLDYFKHSKVDFENIVNKEKPLVETFWRPYRGAVFHMGKLRKDKIIYVSENEYYKYENGTWTCYKLDSNDYIGAEIVGYIIKRMEAKMRVITNFKFKLSPKRTTLISHLSFQLQYFNKDMELKFLEEEDLDRVIDKSVEDYYADKYQILINRQSQTYVKQEKVEIDISKLKKIREDAEIVQEKLIVEHYEDEIVQKQDLDKKEIIDENVKDYDNEWVGLKENLNTADILVLKAIVKNEKSKIDKIAKQVGILKEVLLESINEKAVDFVGDTLIYTSDNEIHIFEDYYDNIISLIGEE